MLERANQEFDADTPEQPVVRERETTSLLGLFSDEPELADQVNELAYAAREAARMRAPHE